METILMLMMFLGLFVLPIYVAVRAWRRGYREWAQAILISWVGMALGVFVTSRFFAAGSVMAQISGVIFALFPPLVSIIAWTKTKEPLAVSVDCLECGSPSKAIRRVSLNQLTGEIVSSEFVGIIWLVIGITCVVIAIMLLVFGLTWKGPGDLPSPIVGSGLLFVAGIIIVRHGRDILLKRPANLIQKVEYKCTECYLAFFQ